MNRDLANVVHTRPTYLELLEMLSYMYAIALKLHIVLQRAKSYIGMFNVLEYFVI